MKFIRTFLMTYSNTLEKLKDRLIGKFSLLCCPFSSLPTDIGLCCSKRFHFRFKLAYVVGVADGL